MSQDRPNDEQLLKQVAKQKALLAVVTKIRESLDLERILEATAMEVCQLLEADRVGVYQFLGAPQWEEGVYIAEARLSPYPSLKGVRIRDECFAQKYKESYEQGQCWVVDDISQIVAPSCYQEILDRLGFKANIVVPLLKGAELWGLLSIHQCEQVRHWQPEEVEFAQAIALHLGIAIQQAELLQDAHQRSQDWQNLLTQVETQKEEQIKLAQQERAVSQVIDKIRRTLDLETIFRATTHEVRHILQCDRVVVYHFHQDWSGEFLYESLGKGWTSLTGPPGLKTVWEDTYLQETQGGRYRHHEILAIDDIYEAGLTQCHIDILEQFQVKAFVVVPVFVGDQLWGLLGTYQNTGTRVWTPREMSLLAQIGNQLGVGVYQAQLLDKTQQQSQILQTTLADLNAIVDNLADGLLVSDIFGRITRYNPALMKLFNLEDVQLIGRDLRDVFPTSLAQLIEKPQRSSRDVMVTEVELGQGRQGQAQTTSIIKESSADEGKQCLGSVILIRDVTVEREIDRLKTEFLANVSHELRTPLTSVLGFASLIQDKLQRVIFPSLPMGDVRCQKTAQQIIENIDIIVSEAERLTDLINDVLDIARMESGVIEWQIQPTSVIEILEGAIATILPLFPPDKNLTLVREFTPHPPLVLADEDRLKQVVINLLSNAIKFTAKGTITCRILDQQDQLEISVSDTGVGVAPENKELIFERFRQVGNILTNKPEGTGLGLPICKQIVEYHGGKIWVESKENQGSTFYFTIPVTQEARQISNEMNQVESLFKETDE